MELQFIVMGLLPGLFFQGLLRNLLSHDEASFSGVAIGHSLSYVPVPNLPGKLRNRRTAPEDCAVLPPFRKFGEIRKCL